MYRRYEDPRKLEKQLAKLKRRYKQTQDEDEKMYLAEEIAELVAKSFDENYTTNFLCGYESNHLLMHSALKDTIISNATEIVEHMLKHPFCYDQDIYSKILTDHVE